MKKIFLILVFLPFSANLFAQDSPGNHIHIVPPPPVADDTVAALTVDIYPSAINLDEVKRKIGYPQMAREKGIQGKVIVRVFVDLNGDYVRHLIIKSDDDQLKSAVEKVLPELIFSPAIKDNLPVNYWVVIPFDFRLDK